jgi:ryanodine receptor 2
MTNGQIKSTEEEKTETVSMFGEERPPELPPASMVPIEEPKPQQETPPVMTSFPNFANYTKRFVYCLARNLYTIKKIALFLAFVINLMLLFYKVTSLMPEDNSSDQSGETDVVGDGIDVVTAATEILGGSY